MTPGSSLGGGVRGAEEMRRDRGRGSTALPAMEGRRRRAGEGDGRARRGARGALGPCRPTWESGASGIVQEALTDTVWVAPAARVEVGAVGARPAGLDLR